MLIKSVWAVRFAQRFGLFYYLHILTTAMYYVSGSGYAGHG